MEYINFKHLYEKGLNDKDYITLIKINQEELISLSGLKGTIKKFEDLDLIYYLKGKKDEIKGIRISDKGKSLLNQINTPKFTDELGQLADTLIELYETYGKENMIGNKLELQKRISWFYHTTGFNFPLIISSVEQHLNENTTSDSDFTTRLDNLFWKPSSVYSVHMNLTDSKLFNIITKKLKMNPNFFVKKKNKSTQWMADIIKLDPPARADKDLYFTGDYKKDIEHIYKVKKMYVKLSRQK